MTINSVAILAALDAQLETRFKLLLTSGDPCREIGIEELRGLAASGHVCARWRGNRIRSVQLIVPAEVAFSSLGETVRRVRDVFHSDANNTTQRASDHLPRFIRRHHPGRCSAFGRQRAGFVDANAV